MHPEMLAIHHDEAARGGSRVGLGLCESSQSNSSCSTQVWAKPLAGNTTAIALYNGANMSQSLAFSFALIGETSSSRLHVRDVWGQQDLGTSVGSFRTPFVVKPHGTAVVIVSHNRTISRHSPL